MMLLNTSFHGYQITDGSRQHLKKTNLVKRRRLPCQLFTKPNDVNNALWSWSRQSGDWKQRSNICRVFIPQYEKFRMLETYYNFSKKMWSEQTEKWDMETDSLYFALSEKELKHCIRPETEAEWLGSEDCTDESTADAKANFFPRKCCDNRNEHHKRKPGLLEEFIWTERLRFCDKTYCS